MKARIELPVDIWILLCEFLFLAFLIKSLQGMELFLSDLAESHLQRGPFNHLPEDKCIPDILHAYRLHSVSYSRETLYYVIGTELDESIAHWRFAYAVFIYELFLGDKGSCSVFSSDYVSKDRTIDKILLHCSFCLHSCSFLSPFYIVSHSVRKWD